MMYMELIPIGEKSLAPTELCAEVHEQTLEFYKAIGLMSPGFHIISKIRTSLSVSVHSKESRTIAIELKLRT